MFIKLTSAFIAYFGLTFSPLEAVSIAPLKSAAMEFVILGIVPFTDFEITFEMLFMSGLLVPLFFLLKSLFLFGRDLVVSFSWNQEYINQISI